MDNLSESSESNEIEAFQNYLNPKEEVAEEATEELPAEAEAEAEQEEEAPELEANAITVEIDGKTVTLTPEQVAEAYKNGLRQSDYTQKTMAVAEERKQAEAAKAQAYQERQTYAEKVSLFALQQQAALNEQQNINWDELLEQDPVEFVKQKHLLEQRQANLAHAQNEWAKIDQLNQQERQASLASYVQAQQQDLLAKLPAWKDEAKAKADKSEIKEFLKAEGFSDQDIAGVVDHRHVLLVRDAMQFRKLLKQSPEATKRVQSAPVKVERAGNANTDTSKDARKQAMGNFKKNPNSDSAAMNAFSALL